MNDQKEQREIMEWDIQTSSEDDVSPERPEAELEQTNEKDTQSQQTTSKIKRKRKKQSNTSILWSVLANLGMTSKVLEVLKGLHEHTCYRITGKEGLSSEWIPARGLREGCATSPTLFNIYHAESMRIAQSKRKEKAKEQQQECGLTWTWTPGNCLPAAEPSRILYSKESETINITDTLFADDSTLIGWTDELKTGKEVVKESMLDFEEKCHDGKEESIAFGTEGAQSTRMLGTLLGRKEDCNARTKRGNAAWAKVRKWLWRSTLSKRTKALVIQAVVESTMLFDSNARSWRQSDIKRLQSVADRCYRFIWNNGKGMALIRMQEKTNTYEIRRQLNITSIRTKIETRCLQRIGHVLRMPNYRLTKQVVLGHWKKERIPEGKLNGGILNYWRRLVKETGED